MLRQRAGLGRKARLNLAPPFHFLIRRLIHPVTYVTILTYDLLSRQPDGETGPGKEGGVWDWAGQFLWSVPSVCGCVYEVVRINKPQDLLEKNNVKAELNSAFFLNRLLFYEWEYTEAYGHTRTSMSRPLDCGLWP